VRTLRVDPRSVFLNFPFDRSYEPVFIGLVAGLVALGLKPRSVIEIPEQGEGRMRRLFDLICSCGASIHDLSRVNTPVRFNMPFELGIAYALHQVTKPAHRFVVLERERHRLDRTLSDLKMLDPRIHRGSGHEALRCIYESFKPRQGAAPEQTGDRIYQRLRANLDEYRGRQTTIFNRLSFEHLIADAIASQKVLTTSTM
jgi:hypothetical protein